MSPVAHILNTERETRRFRLLALMVATATIFYQQDELALLPALIWTVVFFGYTLLLGPVISRLARDRSPTDLTYLILSMILIDAGLVTALVHFAGGITTIAFILIPLFVLYHASYQGYSSGVASATLFSILYVGSTMVEELGLAGPVVVSQLVLFYLLAGLSGYMAKRLMAVEGQKEVLESLIVRASVAHGVRLDDVTLSDNGAALEGEAVDEAAMTRFLEALRAIPRLASVRLARVSDVESAQGRAIAFTVAARVR